MSYSSNFNLNQRISYLESIINQITPSLPLDLANILLQGNSAGATDIDLNNNDILNVNNIDLTTINGSAYPPSSSTDLANVLLQGNSAGATDIDLNNNNILQVDNINLTTINGSAYPPSNPSSSLFNYKAKTTEQSPPVDNGFIYWDNEVQSSANNLFVSHLDDNGNDIDVLLGGLSVGYKILIQDQNNSNNYQQWEITNISPTTPNTFIWFGVTLLESSYSFTNNHAILLITQSANQNLSQVLAVGNNAEGQSITGVNNIDVTTINGSAYPPPSSSLFNYNATTNSQLPPIANGRIEWNTTDQTLATEIYVSKIDSNGNDIEVLLSGIPVNYKLLIQDPSNSANYQQWTITEVYTSSFLSYITFYVGLFYSTYSFSNDDAILLISQSTTQNLSQVLTAGSNATGLNITNLYNLNTSFINEEAYPPASVNQVLVTSDNTDGTCFITYTKDPGTGSKSLYQDDTTTPLTYNPFTSNLTATTFTGDLSGNATTATTATFFNITTTTTNINYYPAFLSSTTGPSRILADTSLTYNPSTDTLTCANIIGNASSSTTSTTATSATNVATTASTTNANFYPTFVSSTTGNNGINVDTSLTYNPSSDTLTCANIIGNASSSTTSTTATNATNSTNVLVTSDNEGALCYLTYTKVSGTGNKALYQDDYTTTLSYNPESGFLSATTFNGALQGNATSSSYTSAVTTTASTANATFYPTFVSSTSGNNGINVDTSLTYNPSTDVLTCATLNGNSTTSTTAGVATTVTVTEDNTNNTGFIPFVYTGAGNRSLLIDSASPALSYNPSTSALTASSFNGALVGSGASITASTIPVGAINANLMTTDTAQSTGSVTAIKTFNSESVFGGLTEQIITASVITGNVANIDYTANPGKIYFLSPFSANNFTVNITNVPLGTFTYRSINFTLIISTTSNKKYCSALNINGTPVSSFLYLGGAANIPSITSASYILQTFNIIITSLAGTVSTVFTSVTPIY